MRRDFWKHDWFSAVVISLLFGIAAFAGAGFLSTFERFGYDFGVRFAAPASQAPDKIAVIAIDDSSIDKIGRWPWPRDIVADVVEQLAQVQPRIIGLQIFFSEEQKDPGLTYIQQLQTLVAESRIPRIAPAEAEQLTGFLQQAAQELDQDQKLADALTASGNVVMPMFFKLGAPLGRPDAALPDFVQRNRLTQILPGAGATPPPALAALYPLPLFGATTAGIGHLNLIPDVDGAIRGEPLVIDYYGEYYPSLAVVLAARSLNLDGSDIEVRLGEGVRIGNLVIETDPRMQMYMGFHPDDGNAPYTLYSFHDVQSGKVPLDLFKNKLVLIGPTALGVGTRQVTPVSKAMTGPELTANTVASILNRNFFTRPAWTTWTEMALFAVILLYLMFVLPRFGAGVAAGISLVLFLALLGGGHLLLTTQHVWLKTVTPALLLLTGHLWLTTKRFFTTEQIKTRVEKDSAQTNRMLGLAFQSQGQLDMALDKFRTLPVDDSVLDLIYNVALDFERKRQFNKAASAYDYILKHNPRFRDVADKRKRAQAAESTIVLGAKAPTAGGTLVLEGVDQKPTLGRYEVEKELGRGAMGAVYLGRDPKINRVVAIKTMALSQEFDENELKDVKERFFREAETAGRLNHPNIVTIFDAGEEQDLAYIAMEYLHGHDLVRYTDAGKLLPVDQALQMISRIADALDFAHKQGVVHRDIKPANIMYDPKDSSLKITDFGIARITASSRTKTGVIMGTPSYMSPEQLAGKHVDGRSDLFSLGVMLFELLTGQQPFRGDSMATLMFRIANEPHADIATVRAGLPTGIRAVIDKALQKDADKRFQSGAEFREALLACAQVMPA